MSWSGYSEQGRGSQERGPGSFALQLPGGVQRTAPRPGGDGSAETRVGIRGGEVRDTSRSYADFRAPRLTPITQQAQLPQVQVQRDPTIDFLGKVGGARMQQWVEAATQESFVKGAAKAASGQAMAEIANEQPWYQSIFGDTALVEGARAYTVKAGVSKWTADHLTKMQDLAQQSPEAVPQYLVESMKAYQTGDSATDQAIQAEMLAQVPVLVKEHTKQHYALLQKRAADAHSASLAQAIESFEGYANGSLQFDPDSAAKMMGNIEEAFTPPPGVNPEAHYDRVSSAIKGAALRGNFKTIGALAGMGYLDALSPEDQFQIDKALRATAPLKLSEAAKQLEPEVREFFLNPPLMKEDRDRAIQQINDRAMDLSGVTPEFGQLIDLDARMRLDSRAQNEIEQAARAQAKAQATAQAGWVAKMAVESGNAQYITNAVNLGGVSWDDMQKEAAKQIAAAPVEVGASIAAGFPRKVGYMADTVTAERSKIMYGSKIDPVVVDAAVKRFQILQAADKTSEYYDSEYAAVLRGLSERSGRGDNIESALEMSRFKVTTMARYTEVPKQAVQEAVDSVLQEKLSQGLGGQMLERFNRSIAPDLSIKPLAPRVNTAQMGMLSRLVGGAVASGLDDGNPESAARSHLKTMIGAGEISMAGRHVIFNSMPQQASGDTSLARFVEGNDAKAQVVVHDVIDMKVRESGVDPDGFIVLRLGDEDGKARFLISGKDSNGVEVVSQFTSDDIIAQHQRALDLAKIGEELARTAPARQAEQATQPQGNTERGGMTDFERQLMGGDRPTSK